MKGIKKPKCSFKFGCKQEIQNCMRSAGLRVAWTTNHAYSQDEKKIIKPQKHQEWEASLSK